MALPGSIAGECSTRSRPGRRRCRTCFTTPGTFPSSRGNLVEDGIAWGYAPRRLTLDKILLDAAVASGVEVREGFSVDEYVFEDGRVAGIHGRGSDGQHVEERATLVVGADGRNSPLARAVQAPTYNQVPPLLCYYFSYWSGVQAEQFELYVRPDEKRVILAFETEDDLFAIFIGFPVDEFPAFRSDIEASFIRTLDSIPGFGERVRAGQRQERFYGASDLPNFYRKPFGPGWALVGDAGMHKDPYLALGICDGLRDAELLATAVGSGLDGKRTMEDALAAYETQRNEASAADYEQNLAAARFLPMPPEVQAVRAAVRNQPDDATQLIKAAMGMIEPQRFFNPQNMQRLLGGAPPASP